MSYISPGLPEHKIDHYSGTFIYLKHLFLITRVKIFFHVPGIRYRRNQALF